MAANLGDFLAGDTIDFKFNTHVDGAPTTLAGTPSLTCYKDNSTTQDADGITLSVDFDSVTGLHHVRITTASDGTFYANGSRFSVVIAAGTVGGNSVVGGVLREFSLGLGVNAKYWNDTAISTALETAADVADAVWDEDLTGHTTTDTAGDLLTTASEAAGLDAAGVRTALGMSSANLDTQLSGIQSDTNDIQTRIPAALVSGRMDASVGAMASNVMTAAAAAADLTTELQSGLATASALATVDTVVDAIKAKTDSLTFTSSGKVDSTVLRVGTTDLTEGGTGGQGYNRSA